jgi:three-Cys-motif partner protein
MTDLLDELGEWSQIKHEIIEKYAHAYTTVLSRQAVIRKTLYIDAFAGTGFGSDRDTGEQLRGSAIRATQVVPRFDELHFVEQDAAKAALLEHAVGADDRVTVHPGDGIAVVGGELLGRCRYVDYRRALCLLDPYDLSVPWSLVQRIGEMRSVEIFYNFMIMDANRNILWRDPSRVPVDRLAKMDLVWGDRSWKEACYEQVPTLFGDVEHKLPNEDVAEGFRRRLQKVATFKYVPKPIAMKNTIGRTVYYLFFASHNETGGKIVEQIFSKYRR